MTDLDFCNADEIVPPKWMDKRFFEKILRPKNSSDKITVKSINIKLGCDNGDHFGSVMYRAVVVYAKGESYAPVTESMIVKILPFGDGPMKEVFESAGFGVKIFKTEIGIYKDVVPKVEAALKAVSDNTQFVANCLYTATEPDLVLIFQDLVVDNYKGVKNWRGKWEIGKKAIEKIAKWHAVTHMLSVEGDKELERFNESFFTEEYVREVPMFRDGFRNFHEMLKSNSELHEYLPLYESILDRGLLGKALRIYKASENKNAHFLVLNHGDFHIKNVMYTESKQGKVDDVKFVDFQLSIWGSPVIDLIYVLYLLIDTDSRLARRNEIIYYYFNHLTESLKMLKFKGKFPILSELHKDFFTFKEFELWVLTTLLPFATAFKQEDQEIENAMLNENDIRHFTSNPEYLAIVRKTLPDLLHKGYLQ